MTKSITKNLKEKTFADLCCGIGGFRLALEDAGAKCVYAYDADKFARQVYEHNFGDAPERDVTKINIDELPDFDILCAALPCEKNSVDDNASVLGRIIDIIRSKNPEVVIFENIVNAVNGEEDVLYIVKYCLKAQGYTVYDSCLNAVDYGVPQIRNRMYIVALRKDVSFKEFEFPAPIELTKCVADILEPEADVPADLYKRADDMVMKTDVKVRKNKPLQIAYVRKNSQGERIYSTDGVAITLTGNGGGRFSKTGGYLIGDKPRKLTARECARLMGFPDTFKIDPSYNQATKQFGNSVVVDVLQHIIANIEYDT